MAKKDKAKKADTAHARHGMTQTMVSVDDVQLLDDNPREGDLETIAHSIRHNGFITPIVVRKADMTVLAGNHRLMAARALGVPEVPAVIVDIDEDTATRFVLADNRASDMASYDQRALGEMLKRFVGDGLDSDGMADALAGTAYSPGYAERAIARGEWEAMTTNQDASEPDAAPQPSNADDGASRTRPQRRETIIEKLGRRSIVLSIPLGSYPDFIVGLASARSAYEVDSNEEALAQMLIDAAHLSPGFELGG